MRSAKPHRSLDNRAASRPSGSSRPLGLLAAAALAASLGGCMGLAGDACTDPNTATGQATTNQKDVLPRNCDGSFLSARNQRSVLYQGDDMPRLWTGEGPRTEGPTIDVSRVNAPPARSTNAPFTGYYNSLRVDYTPDEAVVQADVAEIQTTARRRVDPNQQVTIDFNRASIDFVLKQLLGGALGLNYVAPEDLGGSITFKTETPVAKSQVLGVVRDLLARNGLAIKSIHGIYHVGRPDLIAAIETTGAAGQSGDRATRVVRLKAGNTAELIGLVRQLVPEDVTILPTNAPNTVIVRAAPGDLDQVESMLKSFAANGFGDDKVAIIPLTQSAPDKIAGQLNEFYGSRGVTGLTIVPLDKQQALLVGSKSPDIMNGVRELAKAMDAEARDEIALRIVPLQHMPADEISQKLQTIFGAGGGAPGGAAGASGRGSTSSGRRGSGFGSGSGFNSNGFGSGSDLNSSSGSGSGSGALSRFAPDGPRTGPSSSGTGEEGGSAGAAPSFSYGSSLGGSRGASGSALTGAGGGSPGAGGTNDVRIQADTRSNTVMVFSSFAVFRKVREVLRALDVPQSQVVIEATIVEVELNDQLQSGVQFYLQGRGFSVGSGNTSSLPGANTNISTAGTTGTTTGTTSSSTGSFFNNATSTGTSASSGQFSGTGGTLGVGAQIGTVRVDAVLQALQDITKVKVISSPYLTVVDGKQARLVIGDQIPYARRTQSSNNLGNNTVTQEVEIKDTGIILDVTPRIHTTNAVALKINQSVSTPSESVRTGDLTPVISTRNVESDVLLQSGRTVLLAGLIQDRLEQREGGVPVLRTLPGIGEIFKTKTDAVRRVELIVMITPRVARSTSQMDGVTRLIQSQINSR